MHISSRRVVWGYGRGRVSRFGADPVVQARRGSEGLEPRLPGQERRAFCFVEGGVFEGEINATGGVGALQRWICVAPFGKSELHSVSDPLDLHAMSVFVASRSVTAGTLRAIGQEPRHPAVRLQRAKEFLSIKDTHMGPHRGNLGKMFDLLESASKSREDYVLFAAGEILAMLKTARSGGADVRELERRVLATTLPASVTNFDHQVVECDH